MSRLGFNSLILSSQAPGTQVEPFCLAINNNFSGMDIRRKAAVGVPLGVTDIMTEHRCFPA